MTGNHDIGGSHFLCGESDENFHECESIEEMLQALNAKFDLQSSYVSPYQNRWYMPSHYFKYTIAEGDVMIDIFNIDTNFADSHGAQQVCCQCYGYKDKDWGGNCNDIYPGHEFCAGGDLEMFNACMEQIEAWWNDSVEKIQIDLAQSTADFRVVNSHYSPMFHMSPPKRQVWFDILEQYNVQIFMNGHTHGENHDYATSFGCHFFENGAGGGIQSEASGIPNVPGIENVWVGAGAPYGFFELSASKTHMRMRFITFDDDWIFSDELSAVQKGGGRVDHCWIVPVDGSYGQAC